MMAFEEVVAVRLALRRVGAGENEILVHGEHVDRIDDVMEGAPLPEVVLRLRNYRHGGCDFRSPRERPGRNGLRSTLRQGCPLAIDHPPVPMGAMEMPFGREFGSPSLGGDGAAECGNGQWPSSLSVPGDGPWQMGSPSLLAVDRTATSEWVPPSLGRRTSESPVGRHCHLCARENLGG